MKTNTTWAVVSVMAALPLLAGCLTGPDIVSTLDDTYDFERYHWPEPIVHSHDGAILDAYPGINASNYPHFVQQWVPYATLAPLQLPPSFYPPTVAVGGGSVYVTALDTVQRSDNWGQNWTTSYELRSLQYPQLQDRFEPAGNTVVRDHETGRILAGFNLYGGNQCNVFVHSDDGAAWTHAEQSYPNSCYVDDTGMWGGKPLLATGPLPPEANPANPTNAYGRAIYYCEQTSQYGPHCALSTDGMESFRPVSTFGGLPWQDTVCYVRQNGEPQVAPDGTLVVPIGEFGTQWWSLGRCQLPATVVVSRDGGLTWEYRTWRGNPAMYNINRHTSVALAEDGTSFMVFTAPDGIAYLLRSKDLFQTWEGPWRIPPPTHTATGLVTILASAGDRVSLGYLATEADGAGRYGFGYAPGWSQWHAYVTTSFNADQDNITFVTSQVSPIEDPVDVGGLSANMGAFIDADYDRETGRIVVSFTDGCDVRNGCSGDTDGAYVAFDSQVALLVLDSGLGMYGDVPLQSLGLTHPEPRNYEDDAAKRE